MGSLSLGVFLAAGAAAAKIGGGGGPPPPGDGGGGRDGDGGEAATPEDRLDASYKSLAQVERAYEASLSHEQLAAENEAKKVMRAQSSQARFTARESQQRWGA